MWNYHLTDQQSRIRNLNLTDLAGLCITGSLDLVCTSLGKSNAEQPQAVIVSSLNINMRFNQSLPLAHQRSQLVCGEVHSLKLSKEKLKFSIQDYIKIKRSLCNYANKVNHNATYPEVCENIPPLHILSSKSDLPVSLIFILLKVSQRNLKHSMLKSFRSNLSDRRIQQTSQYQNIKWLVKLKSPNT